MVAVMKILTIWWAQVVSLLIRETIWTVQVLALIDLKIRGMVKNLLSVG